MRYSVNPSEARVQQHASEAVDNKPVVMVNLLRFRQQAEFAGTGIAEPDAEKTGQQAYKKYSKQVLPMLWSVGGQILWQGNARITLIAPDGESWDEALLVYYPNRTAFLNMITSDEYQKIVGYRTAALLDSRLIETKAVSLPKPILAVAGAVTRIKRKLF